MLNAFALLFVLLIPQESDPARQFDFWIGEWAVQNRHLQADNTWRDGDVTRARITPVCGGKALLEEWAGPFRGSFMNGFSLRSFDTVTQRWTILLSWTTDGNGGFGRMQGEFRHGRGEFLSTTQGQKRTRYTFSDALAKTVRWDQASTQDGGLSWSTDWIMEFSRRRAAREVTQDNFFAEPWTPGKVSPHVEARALDRMVGEWTGTQVDADGNEMQARLRCKLINKDCLLVDLLELQAKGSKAWEQRLTVRGYQSGPKAWQSWSLTEQDPVLRASLGKAADLGMSFQRQSASGEPLLTELIEFLPDGSLSIMRASQATNDAEFDVFSTILLHKKKD